MWFYKFQIRFSGNLLHGWTLQIVDEVAVTTSIHTLTRRAFTGTLQNNTSDGFKLSGNFIKNILVSAQKFERMTFKIKWQIYRDAYPVGGGRHRGSAVDLPSKNRAKETDLVSSNISWFSGWNESILPGCDALLAPLNQGRLLVIGRYRQCFISA